MRTALRGLTVTTCAALVLTGLTAPASAASTLSCPAFANAATDQALPVSGADAPMAQQSFTVTTSDSPLPRPVPATGGQSGGDGTFAAVLDLSSLADGTLTVRASSLATPQGASCTVVKDTVVPPVTGLSATRSNASQPATVVGGSTQPGSRVVIVVTDSNGTAAPTQSLTASSGNFTASVDLTGLVDGVITVKATATDPAGNVGPQATATTTRDTSRPAVTGLASTDTSAAQRATTVTGTTEAGASVALTATSPGSSAPVTGTASAPGGSFSATLDLSSLVDGPVTVTATATDTALNTGDPATTSSTKDTGGPSVSGLSGTSVTTASPVTTVTGTVSEVGADVLLVASNGSTSVQRSLTDLTTTSFSTTIDLSSFPVGTITITALATDAFGNSGPGTATSVSKTATSPSPSPTSTSSPSPSPSASPSASPTASPTGTPSPSASPGSTGITGLAATNSGPSRTATVVTGSTGANRTVTVTVVNAAGDTATGSAVAGSTGAFSVTIELRSFRSGAFTVTALSRDAAGSSGSPATTTATRDGRPAAPSQPGARAGDAAVRVLLFGAPFDNGSPLTGYRAVATPGGRVFTAPSGATSILAQGLTNGVAYTFVVTASNARGESAASPATPAVTPRFATVVSINGSPSPVVAGSPLRLTGSLKRKTSGAALIGFRVTVKATFDNKTSKTLGTVATNTNGVWVLTTTPSQNATYTVAYAGRPEDAPTSASRRILARTKVTLSAPSGGARSALVMSGSTSPNKKGSRVTVYRVVNGRETAIASATVSSTGSYRVSKVLARGSYVLVARIGATAGNAAGFSPRVTTRRT